MESLGGTESLEKGNPAGRLGTPADIAGTLVYLCGRGAGHVNGALLQVDGGKVWARSEL